MDVGTGHMACHRPTCAGGLHVCRGDCSHAVVGHALRVVVEIDAAVRPKSRVHPLLWALERRVRIVPREVPERERSTSMKDTSKAL